MHPSSHKRCAQTHHETHKAGAAVHPHGVNAQPAHFAFLSPCWPLPGVSMPQSATTTGFDVRPEPLPTPSIVLTTS